MTKCTFKELCDKFTKSGNYCSSDKYEMAVIVYDPIGSDWKGAKDGSKVYSLKECTYKVSSCSKYFDPSIGGNSLFGDCLDGIDRCIRLDYYIGDWIVDYCIIFDSINEYNEYVRKIISNEE